MILLICNLLLSEVAKNFFTFFTIHERKENYMPAINPINMLNAKAHNAVAGVATDSPLKKHYIQEFFEAANKKYSTGEKEHNVQGLALLSYFTHLNSIKDNKGLINQRFMPNARNITNIILEEAKNSPIKESADKFVEQLNKDYHNSLGMRILLAKNGIINSQNSVKKSKIGVRICLMLDKMIDVFKPIGEKIQEFCKPVE